LSSESYPLGSNYFESDTKSQEMLLSLII